MQKITDHIGIVLSCVCMVHCILLPIAVVLSLISAPWPGFHEAMIGLTALISGHALWHGYKVHCNHIVLLYGGFGIFSMAIALLGSAVFETAATVIGALLILIAHVFNLRSQRCSVNSETQTGDCHETCNRD